METQIVIVNNEIINILSCIFVAYKTKYFLVLSIQHHFIGAFTFYKRKHFTSVNLKENSANKV